MTKRGWIGTSLVISLVTMACGDDEAGNGASCEEICARIEAPACGNTAPKCVASCEEERLNTPTDCQSEINALTSCFARATFHCDADDVPQADDCKPELDRWIACSDGTNLPGGSDDDEPETPPFNGGEKPGTGDGDELVCQAKPNDDACTSCLKGSCCEETSACGDACQRILSCVETCPDDTCMEACVQDNLDGAYQFSLVGTCMVQNCAGSCELGE